MLLGRNFEEVDPFGEALQELVDELPPQPEADPRRRHFGVEPQVPTPHDAAPAPPFFTAFGGAFFGAGAVAAAVADDVVAGGGVAADVSVGAGIAAAVGVAAGVSLAADVVGAAAFAEPPQPLAEHDF